MFNYLNRVSQFAFFFFACSNHFWVITRLFSSPQFYFGESINPPSARPLVGQGGQNSTAHALIPSSIKEIGSLPPSMDGYAKTVAALRTISFEYQVTRAVTSGCEKMRPLVLYDRKGVCWCMSKGKFGGPSPFAAWQPKGRCGDCRGNNLSFILKQWWQNGTLRFWFPSVLWKVERFDFSYGHRSSAPRWETIRTSVSPVVSLVAVFILNTIPSVGRGHEINIQNY